MMPVLFRVLKYCFKSTIVFVHILGAKKARENCMFYYRRRRYSLGRPVGVSPLSTCGEGWLKAGVRLCAKTEDLLLLVGRGWVGYN